MLAIATMLGATLTRGLALLLPPLFAPLLAALASLARALATTRR